MSATFFWRCEGTTLSGTDDLSPDTSATGNGTISIDPAAAKVGSNGILVGAANSHYRFTPTSIIAPAAGAVAMWVRITNDGSALTQIWLSRGANASDFYSVQANSSFNAGTGTFRLVHGTTAGGGSTATVVTSGGSLAENTWYFVVAKWSVTSTIKRIEVYNTSGTLIASGETVAAFTAPADLALADGLRFGEASGVTVAMHLDNIFVGSAYADGDIFVTNRDITSYTSYALPGAVITGTGAATIQRATSSGSGHRGLHDLPGAIALNFVAMQVSGVGTVTHAGPTAITGTGALSINPVTIVDATGLRGLHGSGALATPKPTVVGLQGPRNRTGTGAIEILLPTIVGAGVRRITGTGVLACPKARVVGIGLGVDLGVQYNLPLAHGPARKSPLIYPHKANPRG